ncbi:acyltransferase [Alteromonadaceae bacterium BrNp21-10]|nr:acyltransferase [Alteromonadaceae bacterium BrNp21-10]
MLSFLPVFILLPLNILLQLINLLLWTTLIIMLGLLKLVLPVPVLQRSIRFLLDGCLNNFGRCSVGCINLTNKVQWDVQIDGDLSPNGWYLLLSNHISWVDIFLITHFAASRIPASKYFVKQELLWVPFIGMGCWALDMPFMKRYSRSFINKHPHLKGKDIDSTRKACEKFKKIPTTIVNFVEGSRLTPEKHTKRDSPYQYLLPPRAGGIAFTLASMGEQFSNVIDFTIVFPLNQHNVMYAMLCGRLHKIVLRAQILPVEDSLTGDYFNDESYKAQFQQWLNNRWQQKDQLIQSIINNHQEVTWNSRTK